MNKKYLEFLHLSISQMSRFISLKRGGGFTLVELIIVIAVITILAGIVVVAINPASIFANARNGQRGNDLATIQAAITKYIAESPISGTPRTLTNTIGNYGTVGGAATSGNLISGAAGSFGAYSTTGVQGNCPSGSTGTLTSGTSGYTLKSTGTASAATSNSNGQVDLSVLVSAGYLPKVPTDPTSGQVYKMCIDTSVPSGNSNAAPGKLVIFAPGAENGATIPYVVI